MVKQDVLRAVAETSGMTQVAAEKVIEAFVACIARGLVEDGEFAYPGMGKFKMKTLAGRAGRNPQTGQAIEIPPRTRVGFKAAPAFVERAT